MFTKIAAAATALLTCLCSAPSCADDIYAIPARGLTPQIDALGDVSVVVGRFEGYETADVAGESKIGYIRLRVAGGRDPLVIYIAYPLTVSGGGQAMTWNCSMTPRVAATWGSCEGQAYDTILSGTETARVLVQRVLIRGTPVLITHQIERVSAKAP